MAEKPAFFVRGDDGEEYGPVELAELRDWVAENRVGLGTSARLDAPEGAWYPWQHYPELVALLAEVHATGGPGALPVLAPFGRRALAFVIDLIFVVGPVFALLICMLPDNLIDYIVRYSQIASQGLTPSIPPPVVPLWFQIWSDVLLLVVPMAYYAGFHAARGRTPAKAVLHLQVVDVNGRKPGLAKALLRAFVLVVCVYFVWGIPISLCFALLNPQRRALHDVAAGTYVVEL
jgi:uncharacterized RDD family membrane protein YckC